MCEFEGGARCPAEDAHVRVVWTSALKLSSEFETESCEILGDIWVWVSDESSLLHSDPELQLHIAT